MVSVIPVTVSCARNEVLVAAVAFGTCSGRAILSFLQAAAAAERRSALAGQTTGHFLVSPGLRRAFGHATLWLRPGRTAAQILAKINRKDEAMLRTLPSPKSRKDRPSMPIVQKNVCRGVPGAGEERGGGLWSTRMEPGVCGKLALPSLEGLRRSFSV
jgi:hypothetical protein